MCEGPLGLRARCAGQPGAGRCMGQGWRPWKGHRYHTQEFEHGLRAVTGAFGPGNDRAMSAAQKGPPSTMRGQSVKEQVGGWQIRNEWTSAAAQGTSDWA